GAVAGSSVERGSAEGGESGVGFKFNFSLNCSNMFALTPGIKFSASEDLWFAGSMSIFAELVESRNGAEESTSSG
ncbi:MAG: hypothetical protein QGH86_11985, partial [SAR324 cluster bacterium]|nr:hypothetical protein [SAR324 cluster bacterium]